MKHEYTVIITFEMDPIKEKLEGLSDDLVNILSKKDVENFQIRFSEPINL